MSELKVESIMSKEVVTVGRSIPLRRVLELMARKRISAIAIVEDGNPLGIFTERDGVTLSIGQNLDLDTRIGEFMTENPICISQDKDLYAAYQSMQELGIRHLLVEDETGSLSGIVTEEDVVAHLVSCFFGQFGSIEPVMSRNLITAQENDTLDRQEAHFRRLYEEAPLPYQSLDEHGMFLKVNRAWLETFGYSKEAVIGRFFSDFLTPGQEALLRERFDHFITRGSIRDIEFSMLCGDGSQRLVRVDGRIAYDEHGRFLHTNCILTDITERKALEAKIRKSNRELETLLNSIPAPVYFMDKELRYQSVNRAYLDFVRLREDEVIGRTDRELFASNLAQEFEVSDSQVLEEGRVFEGIEQQVPDFEGNLRWFSATKTPIRNCSGNVAGLVGISYEITELKQAEQQRRVAEQKQRDTLIQEVHHRIKNHLQGVVNLMRLQSEEKLPDPLREESIVSQIRTIADVYGLQSDSETGHVYICDMLGAALKVHKATCKLPINYRHEQIGRAALVAGESVPVALVINELITNAIKHTPPDRTDEPISIRLRTDAHRAYLTIRNPADSLPEGFDPEAGENLGTGLRLVRTLLPPQGSHLAISHSTGLVTAELSLESPVVSTLSS